MNYEENTAIKRVIPEDTTYRMLAGSPMCEVILEECEATRQMSEYVFANVTNLFLFPRC
jgi:hypothetical protein